VITVGASTDDGVTALYARVIGTEAEGRPLEMRMMEGSSPLPESGLEASYVACGMGVKPEDFPAAVSGRIALIERGEITFREKAAAAEKAGAAAAVIFNNREGNFFGSLGDGENGPKIPVVSISKVDGLFLRQLGFEPGGAVSTALLRLDPEEVPQPDRLAEFSSRGPNNDLRIKPEIVAPGVNILSATITQAPIPGGGMADISGYISASGTSMATPHVAGAAALIKQARPELNAFQIKAVLVNTAEQFDRMGTVLDQGAGRLSLRRALEARACLVTGKEPGTPTHTFGQVSDEGKKKSMRQLFKVVDLGAGEEISYQLGVELAGQPDGLTARLSTETLIVPAGCSAYFEVELAADGSRLAEGGYYGWITAEAGWGTLRLPLYYEAVRGRSGDQSPIRQSHTREAPERDRGLDCC
jgi:minor extracellular serine protease Vpr